MRTYRLQRFTPFLIVLLLLTGLVTAFTPTATQAQTTYTPSSVSRVVIDPTDNSVWVLWYDAATYNISHFDAQGRLLKQQPIGASLALNGDFVLLPNSPRFYAQPYTDINIYAAPVYQDLTNSTTVTLTAPAKLPTCTTSPYSRTFKQAVVYNPVNQHVYINCGDVGRNDSRSYVIDTKTNAITGTLPYVITAYNPVNQQLYTALERTNNNPNNSYPILSVGALSASNELPIPQGALKDIGILGFINSVNVNTKTGTVYFAAATCYAKCAGPLMSIFDKNNQPVEVGGGQALASYYTAINETTNQLYGPRNGNLNREDVAVDVNKPYGGELAGFYWSVLAVDQNRNLAYAVERIYDAGSTNYERGLSLLVMDGKNYDIMRYINLSGPSQNQTQAATRLPGPPANFQGYYFSETGHTLEGKFLDYWLKNGGLAQFGYPLTQPFQEYNPDSNKVFTVQYFERNRFELHPENAGTPFEVELGLLGRSFSSRTGVFPVGSNYNSGETEPVEGGVRFKETGHTLTGKFYAYWLAQGGLAQFGLPLTEPFQEVSPTDGQTYTVQYFERNRFEYHPEFVNTLYEVELGLLGQQLLLARGWPI